MNKTDLAFTPALELSKLVRNGDISPTELTQLYLERIETFEPQLGSFTYIAPEQALKNAQAKTEQLAKTQDKSKLPPFFGIPTAIKDLFAVKGMPCTYGNAMLKDNISDYDEGIVTRIKQAGFVILGKTATSEFGALPYTEPLGFPPCRNPWHLDYTSGGSSGGAAAAVAGGLIPLAPGSDGGGSVRGPASCCGLVGLKPSRGRVSNAPVGDYQGGIATHGCLSRNVADGAALLDVMAGYIIGDPYWLPDPQISFGEALIQDIPPLKIAFAPSLANFPPAEPLIQQQVKDIASILTNQGHILEEVCPDFTPLIEPFCKVWQAGIAMVGVPEEILSPMSLWLKKEAGTLGDYLQAVHQMQIIARQIVAFFESYDVLLLPTNLHSPLQIGQWSHLSHQDTLNQIINWVAPCPPFNASGNPAIAIPTGFTAEGVPVSVQLVGKPAAETTIINLAHQLEKVKQWDNYYPQIFS